MLSGCYQIDYNGELIKSPTGLFEIQASVNRTDKEKDNFAEVTIQLFDQTKDKISDIKSGVGDANKWAIGWTTVGDTIILQSSDIGNKAWTIIEKEIREIQLNDELNNRAEELKAQKYK